MNRQTVKRLMTKGIIAYVAVFALVLMVAMPAMALIAARNSVNRRSIINGEVTYRDIGKGQVRTSEIAPKAVRYGKIADGAVRGKHIKDGHVRSAEIGDGSITNADVASGAAIADSKLSYSTKTKYLTIVGAEFRAKDTSAGFDIGEDTGSLWANTGGSSVYFFAAANLPDGARVTNIQLNCIDNTDAPNAEAQLRRVNDSNTYNTLAVATSSGESTSSRSFDDNNGLINKPLIDNQNYVYFARIRLSGVADTDMKLGFVRITYTIAGP